VPGLISHWNGTDPGLLNDSSIFFLNFLDAFVPFFVTSCDVLFPFYIGYEGELATWFVCPGVTEGADCGAIGILVLLEEHDIENGQIFCFFSWIGLSETMTKMITGVNRFVKSNE
jgi:hypothetical protein